MLHPILNLADVELSPRPPAFAASGPAAERYDARMGMIAPRVGAQKLGYNLTAVPPGKRAFPFHNHRINEEMFFVVEGTGEIRIGEATYPIRAGDVIACPPGGKETAHQIVNTGATDPMEPLIAASHSHGAWVHVDGAFGLWGTASVRTRAQLRGVDRADSWAVDAHKWLNVPYDSGVAIVRDPEILQRAVGTSASYLVRSSGLRDGVDFVPEFSRRGRGTPVYATLRALGRRGVEDLVDRCCARARRFAEQLERAPGVHVLNEVALNQVLVRFDSPGGGDADAFTREVISRVQADGTCWLGGSKWKGKDVMRISVSGWNTTEEDVDRSVSAILRCAGRA